jgi:glycosyltransferase involved in cell wall biosynthesis
MFSYGLPVPGAKRGGIERAAHLLADGLAHRRCDVTVFTHDPKPLNACYEVRHLPYKALIDTWFGRRVTMGYLGNLLALAPDYREFDAIIAHGDSLLLPLSGKPVIRLFHGSALGEARSARSLGRKLLQAGVYIQELATALLQPGAVAVSHSTQRENPFARRVIPLAADERLFTPEPAERSTEPSVLFVGTLSGRKRGRFLLRAFSDVVRRAHPKATLTIVGETGPPEPGVTYRVGVEDRELSALYRRAWIYASPSTYEGFGLPYLESMACGTPVVATPNPGSLEVLGSGRSGLLVSDADFASTISTLLADADARASWSARGLSRAREFSLKAMLDRYEALLLELVGPDVASVPSH